MDQDPLARIADSYKTIAETQQILAETQRELHHAALRSEDMHRYALRTIRGLAWLQGFAIAVLGLSLLGTGYLVWQHLAHSADHAALTQALLERLAAQHAERLDRLDVLIEQQVALTVAVRGVTEHLAMQYLDVQARLTRMETTLNAIKVCSTGAMDTRRRPEA
jgi:hypothetical protein